MIDRLESLKRLGKGDEINHPSCELKGEERKVDTYDEFLENLNQTKVILSILTQNLEKLKVLEKEIKSAVTSKKDQEIREILKSTNQDNLQTYENLKKNLNVMKEYLKNCNPDDPEIRMKKQLLGALIGKFKEFSKEYQLTQVSISKASNERIIRQAKIYDKNLSEDELNKLCDDPDKLNEVLIEKMNGSKNVFIENFVSDIQDKYADIKILEENVNKVYQLFVDMAFLTHQQGEFLDNIEIAIGDGKNYIEEGNEKLIEAKVEHKKSRKFMCIIAIIITVICGIVFGIVFGALK